MSAASVSEFSRRFPGLSRDVIALVWQHRAGNLRAIEGDLANLDQERQTALAQQRPQPQQPQQQPPQQPPQQQQPLPESPAQPIGAERRESFTTPRTPLSSSLPSTLPSAPSQARGGKSHRSHSHSHNKPPQERGRAGGEGAAHPARPRSRSEVSAGPSHERLVSRGVPVRRVLHDLSVQRDDDREGVWVASVNISGAPTIAGVFSSRAVALSMRPHLAPPVWQEASQCQVCSKELRFLARKHHCRNCGHVVCGSCSGTRWPVAMVPPLYCIRPDNHRVENRTVRVCDNCHTYTEAFREGLLSGDLETCVSLFERGNVNLTRPYTIYPNQMLPVHCAALGGNVAVLRWLVNTQNCPVVHPESGRPVCTQQGETILALACRRRHAAVVFVCLREFGCSLAEVNDVDSLQGMLGAFVNIVSEEDVFGPPSSPPATPNNTTGGAPGDQSNSASLPVPIEEEEVEEESCCIVCFERVIDCVLVPCGHSCVCLLCSNVLHNECPVCRNQFRQAVRIFHVHNRRSNSNTPIASPISSPRPTPHNAAASVQSPSDAPRHQQDAGSGESEEASASASSEGDEEGPGFPLE